MVETIRNPQGILDFNQSGNQVINPMKLSFEPCVEEGRTINFQELFRTLGGRGMKL